MQYLDSDLRIGRQSHFTHLTGAVVTPPSVWYRQLEDYQETLLLIHHLRKMLHFSHSESQSKVVSGVAGLLNECRV